MKKAIKDAFVDIISFINYIFIVTINFIRKKSIIRVLVYHSIPTSDSGDNIDMEVPSVILEGQIDYLSRKGFKFLEADNLIKITESKTFSDNKKAVLITFDDGFYNNYLNAVRILDRNKIKALFFIAAEELGKGSFSWLPGNNYGRPLNWQEVKEISARGHLIGSHTLNHKCLSKIDRDDLKKEIFESKKIIEKNIQKEVKYISYPFGFYDSFNEKIKNLCKEAGYKAAFSNILGDVNKNSDLYELRRVRISKKDKGLRFIMKLAGAYDWVDSIKRIV